jgi:hypothetical protein
MTQETFAEMARRHRDADMLVDGTFAMVRGQACSIGCFCYDYGLRENDFEGLAKLTGYPQSAHYLQEAIFEGLPKTERADWHVAFADKAETITDWRTCIDKTVLASLRIAEPHDTSESKVVAAVIDLYERRLNGDNPSETEWETAGQIAAAEAKVAEEDAASAAARNAARAAMVNAPRYSARNVALNAARAAMVNAPRYSARNVALNAAWAGPGARADAWVQIRNAFLNA